MANTRDIRRRIKSVKNTQQITRAMQTVSAAKMRKAQQAATAGREYATLLNRVLVSLRERVEQDSHPLLAERPVKKELTILISTDKGLCGALNTNLFREAGLLEPRDDRVRRHRAQGACSTSRAPSAISSPISWSRTRRRCTRRGRFPGSPSRNFSRAKWTRSTWFTAASSTRSIQQPTLLTLLPISPAIHAGLRQARRRSATRRSTRRRTRDNRNGYLFEPDATSVLDAILPEYVHFQVYQMVLNARASEHSARMVAMKNATDNAKSLIKDLTLEYNKVRQAAITTELLEITTAQMAMG